LGLDDLTIGLFMSSRNWYKNPMWSSLHRCYRKACAKSVANWKELSSFIWDIFSNFSEPRRIRKNRNHQKFCWCRWSIFL